MKRWINSLIYFIVFGIGTSFQMIANIGYGSVDSLIMTFSDLGKISTGLSTILVSTIMVILNILIVKKIKLSTLMTELIMSLVLGSIINVFYYKILNQIPLNSIYAKSCVMFIGIELSAFSAAIMAKKKLFKSPFESFSYELSNKLNYSYSTTRWGIDIISFLIVIFAKMVLGSTVAIGLGTFMSLILFSSSIKLWTHILRNIKEDT